MVCDSTRKQFEVLKRLMHDPTVDTVVCATDAGREGELIFRLVYEKAGCQKPVKRLWISSLEESAIHEGFRALRDGRDYDNLYRAALCRAQADWLVGINATRLFSLLYGTTLNVGRVMSPTLALIVQREAEIAFFQSEPFYTVQMSCSLLATTPRMKEKADAERIAQQCNLKTAVVKNIDKKRKTEKPPALYDLTSLQREANRLFGYTAQQTLDYAQALYEKRLLTYPRTDSRFLTGDMAVSLPNLVQAVSGAFPFTAGLNLAMNAERVINDSKVTDHHALLPTKSMPHPTSWHSRQANAIFSLWLLSGCSVPWAMIMCTMKRPSRWNVKTSRLPGKAKLLCRWAEDSRSHVQRQHGRKNQPRTSGKGLSHSCAGGRPDAFARYDQAEGRKNNTAQAPPRIACSPPWKPQAQRTHRMTLNTRDSEPLPPAQASLKS